MEVWDRRQNQFASGATVGSVDDFVFSFEEFADRNPIDFPHKLCYNAIASGHNILNLWHCFRAFILVYVSEHL